MRTRALLAVLALTLAVAPLPARAYDPGSCGGRYTGARSCDLGLHGMPVVFNGDAINNSGQASVRVWVSPRGYRDIVLFECSARAGGFTRCDGGFPDQSNGENFPPHLQILALECHVQGTTSGFYGCATGYRPPPPPPG